MEATTTETISLTKTHVDALRTAVDGILRSGSLPAATRMVCEALALLLRGPLPTFELAERSVMPGLTSTISRDGTAEILVAPGLPAQFLSAALAECLERAAMPYDLRDLQVYLGDLEHA